MLEVLCGESELVEYAQVVEVGETIRWMGVKRRERQFETGLDAVEYRFDRYAEVVGWYSPLCIVGEVDAIAAIFVQLVRIGGAVRVQPGSALLEPLRSTAQTRRPVRSKRQVSDSVAPGWVPVVPEPGDEVLWGWRLTLTDVSVGPWTISPRGE